jgi:hypothetical protein
LGKGGIDREMINAYTILMLISLKMPLGNTACWWDRVGSSRDGKMFVSAF